MIKRPSPTWLRRHAIAATTIAVTLVGCSTFLTLVHFSTQQKIQTIEQKSAESVKKYDEIIARYKQEAEAKRKADEATATKVAEEAKTAMPVTSPDTAAKCANLLRAHSDPNNIDILVNKAHCLSPLDFTPADLTSVDGYLMSAKAAPHLRDMLAAASASGLGISITSSYRSYQNQITTYNGWVAANGSTEAADTVSARPGYSEHQTGLAVDLGTSGCVLECFAGTPHYTWLQQNAAKYGFIQRYYAGHEGTTGYSPEAWHYRYVGTEVALDMKAKGVKTLEQYWGISGGNYPI
jgi:D-alanyl-D-alanine carboxypeptidase